MMSREEKRLTRLICFYAVVIIFLAWLMPSELNWSPSFSKNKNWPYGSKILYEQLNQIFPNQLLQISDRPSYNTLSDTTYGNYLSISDQFTADELDKNMILDFVSRGNTVFLASEVFDETFLDTFNLTLTFEFKTSEIGSVPSDETFLQFSFANSVLGPETEYSMKAIRFYRHFESLYDSIPLKALGFIEKDKVCFTNVSFGKGQIFLHSFPYAFSNYHMLQENNLSYVSNCLSYLPIAPLIWDEYYKLDRRNRQDSPMRTILQSNSFRWAYWISIISLFLFMIFHIKRRQAAIPVLEVFENNSLLFTNTIGDLYFEKGNNHKLALKKIAIFKEYLHRNYFFENIRFEEKEISSLSIKSGKDLNFVRDLWAYIQHIRKVNFLDDQQLKKLSKMLNLFYGRVHQ